MTTLPTDIPKLDALVRAEAERLACEIQDVCRYPYAVQERRTAEWSGYLDDIGCLLRDLGRPESRDWAVRALAGLVGVEVGATAPSWYWSAEVRDPTDRDGAPNGDGWPAGWWLTGINGHIVFFSAEDWCQDGDCHHHIIPGLPTGPENAAPALCLALTSVCRDA